MKHSKSINVELDDEFIEVDTEDGGCAKITHIELEGNLFIRLQSYSGKK